MDTEEFVNRSVKVHGTKYDYSEVNCTSVKDKVTIRCPEGHTFRVAPKHHFSGQGCQICSNKTVSLNYTFPTEKWVSKAKSIHGEKYDYANTVYKGAKEKVEIYCRCCNKYFSQYPHNHVTTQGCSNCYKGGYRADKKGTLYLLHCLETSTIKVGVTNRRVSTRLGEINRNSPMGFTVFESFSFDDGKIALDIENNCLKYLDKKYSGVESIFSGSTECFVVDEPIQVLHYVMNTIIKDRL